MGNPPAQGPEDYFSPGDWNIYCSICGTKLKFSKAVRNWQGQWRHVRCDEPRHPQDFVHAINQPEMAIPFPQKMGEAFIYACSLDDTSPIPGLGVPGCMLPGTAYCTALGSSTIPGNATPGCSIPGGH
jgi:hypothetical protein